MKRTRSARKIKEDIQASQKGVSPHETSRKAAMEKFGYVVLGMLVSSMIGKPLERGGLDTQDFLIDLTMPAARQVWNKINPPDIIEVRGPFSAHAKAAKTILNSPTPPSLSSPTKDKSLLDATHITLDLMVKNGNPPDAPTSQLNAARNFLSLNPKDHLKATALLAPPKPAPAQEMDLAI